MTQHEYSPYQQKIISSYYDQLDTIMLHKLQELVSELYLADTDAKQNRLWQRVDKAMAKLKVPAEIATHIMAGRDVEVLAKNLQDWLARSKPRK